MTHYNQLMKAGDILLKIWETNRKLIASIITSAQKSLNLLQYSAIRQSVITFG